MNEIVHLQRDLHANDFALVKKNTTVELERFYLPFFVSERVALRSMLGVSSRLLLQCNCPRLCLGGGDACSCNALHCWFHWNLQLLSSVLKKWRQILQLRHKECRKKKNLL